MSRFATILRDVDERLDLPQPAKSRIILEMATDLDDLFEAYVQSGIDEDEAARRVEESFTITDEVLSELVSIHESPARQFLQGLSERVRSRGERVAFAALLLFLVVVAGRSAMTAEFFADASAFVWPILGLSAASAALAASKAYQLWVRGDHRPGRLRVGLGPILTLGVSGLILGLYGAAAEMYFAAGRVIRGGPDALQHVTGSLLRICPLVMASLFTAIIASVLWHILVERIERIEVAQAAVLLGD